jgi:hypothetical protein
MELIFVEGHWALTWYCWPGRCVSGHILSSQTPSQNPRFQSALSVITVKNSSKSDSWQKHCHSSHHKIVMMATWRQYYWASIPCILYSKIHTLSPEIRRLSLVGWNSRYVTRRLCRRITALSTPFGITGVSFTWEHTQNLCWGMQNTMLWTTNIISM